MPVDNAQGLCRWLTHKKKKEERNKLAHTWSWWCTILTRHLTPLPAKGGAHNIDGERASHLTRGRAGGSTSYTQVAKLMASDKQADDRFGTSVSISGDGRTIAAGATGGDGSAAGASMLEGLDPNSEEYKEMSEMLNATGMLAVPTKAPPSSSDNPGTKARDSGAAHIFAAPPPPPPPTTTTTTTTTTSTTTSPPRFPPVPPLGELPDPPPSGAFPPGVPSNAPTLTGLSVAIGISTLLVCYNSASS